MNVPMFADSILKCHRALIPKNVDLINIVTTEDGSTFDNVLNSYLGIVAIQVKSLSLNTPQKLKTTLATSTKVQPREIIKGTIVKFLLYIELHRIYNS